MSELEESLGSGLATINKIQTTLDNGARITLDFGADSEALIKRLLSIKMGADYPIMVACVGVSLE